MEFAEFSHNYNFSEHIASNKTVSLNFLNQLDSYIFACGYILGADYLAKSSFTKMPDYFVI